MKTLYLYIGGTAAAVVISAALAWFIFASAPPQNSSAGQSSTFGALTNSTEATPSGGGSVDTGSVAAAPNGTLSDSGAVQITQSKVFKISDGPVAGATFVQTSFPTTTLVRFVMANNGHAYDLAIDTPGAAAMSLSNTTIPGALSAQWAQGSAVLQYLEGSTPKTVYLGLPAPNATTTAPVRLTFYPDGITSLAVAPGGSQVAYLLPTAAGADGYLANVDGTGATKLFSLPLTQVQLRWPAPGMLLAYSNAAAGVPGIAFSIDAKTGAVTPLVYAPGLAVNADSSFTHILYQTATADGRASYDHDVESGGEAALSFSPNPEQCTQSPLSGTVLLCAVPLSYVPPNYLDLWHQGTISAGDSLMVYDLKSGTSGLLATPGSSQDGGVATDMLQIAASPDGHYALFISKYDRSLWGVRLTQ